MYLRPQGKSWDFNQGVCVKGNSLTPKKQAVLGEKDDSEV